MAVGWTALVTFTLTCATASPAVALSVAVPAFRPVSSQRSVSSFHETVNIFVLPLS